MSKSFLFITPLTPKRLLTPLREKLFHEFLRALNQQTYTNWQAILIGEEHKEEGNIRYLSLGAESKEIKLIYAKEYILNLKQKPDYLIRIDDDDIINPCILEKIAGLEFDCYADRYHAFYDLTGGKISLQQRDWLANTVVHKYEHAMIEMGEDKIPLIQCDHSEMWGRYYQDKKICFAAKTTPVYLRVLSPTTVTSNIHGINNKNITERYNHFKASITSLRTIKDIDFNHYRSYLRGFGKWKMQILPNFKASQQALEELWGSFYGTAGKRNTLLTKIRRKWNSLLG